MSNENVQNSPDESSQQSINNDIFFAPLEEKETEEESTETAENPENQKEENQAEKALLSCLFAPTYLMESTLTSQNEDGIVQSEPINHFYFCSANKLTIGYGTKIECDSKGKLAKEGIQALQQLKIYKGNRELSEKEKQQLVRDCCAARNRYDHIHGENKFCKLGIHSQSRVLFGSNPALVTKESALDTALTEYKNKQQKLLENNKNFNMNLIVSTIGTDLAYQYGSRGVATKQGSTYFYKCVKKGYLPQNGQFDPKYGDRTLLRNWMLQTARLFEDDKRKRKEEPATPESQSKIFMTALKSFEKTFHQHIMNRQQHVKILMDQCMALVMTQNFQNIYGRYPQPEEIENIRQTSQDFVYKELYGSTEIARVEKPYRENAIANAIKEADTNAPNPLVSIRAATKKVADKSVAQSEEKAKKNPQKPSLSAILKSAEEKTEGVDLNLFINQETNTQGRA